MWNVINGNNIDILKTYEDNSFDAIVTDPPYGIEFLGKDWDSNTGARETWEECFRVLKPGGHLLAFSAARTYHHLATNVEMAGFEIRDQLMWLYGSGFPKAQDIGKAIDKRMGKQDPNYGTDFTSSGVPLEGEYKGSPRCNVCNKTIGTWTKDCQEQDCGMKYNPQTEQAQQWSGWKTALKPAHEPIVMARKPFKGSAIDNVLEHGVGALNIDATRIETDDNLNGGAYCKNSKKNTDGSPSWAIGTANTEYQPPQGRFPSNVIMDEVAGQILDEQAPKTGNGHSPKTKTAGYGKFGGGSSEYHGAGDRHGGLSGASKFFYCPKVSRKERHINGEAENNHPTVKPVELMKYLVRMVTPKGGKVLDPFNGSGSTGMACVELGYDYVGCELDPDYVEIARQRIRAWEKRFDQPKYNLFD